MNIKKLLAILCLGGTTLIGTKNIGVAQDASFGCKVLLCAAASAPNWSGIPYCVPVMKQLFHDLAKGRGWPNCSEANASDVKYEPFKSCPKNMSAYSSNYTSGSTGNNRDSTIPGYQTWQQDVNGDSCANPNYMHVGTCDGDAATYGNCIYPSVNPVPREKNSEPYYVDLSPKNHSSFRFYFDLKEK